MTGSFENKRVQQDYIGLEREFSARGAAVTVSAGISLSNSPHIGHMREFFVAHSASEYLRSRDVDTRVVAVADDLDPLKKVYPDMPESFHEFVGQPIVNIPDHTDQFETRVEKNLYELNQALDILGMQFETVRSSALYETPEMIAIKERLLRESGRVGLILAQVTGSENETSKGMINVICPHCSRVNVKYRSNEASSQAFLTCYSCERDDEVNLLDPMNKLRWRIDWPARWVALGVDVEPVAEDHATKGGSFESARRILEDLYDVSPPIGVQYKWVRHESGAAIHGSESPLTTYRASKLVAPAALRSFFGAHSNETPITVRPDQLLRDSLLSFAEVEDVPSNDELSVIYRLANLADILPSHAAEKVFSIRNKDILKVLDESSWEPSDSSVEIDENYRLAVENVLAKLAGIDWPENDVDLEVLVRGFFDSELDRRKIFETIYQLLIDESKGPRLTRLLRAVEQGGVATILSKRQNERKIHSKSE